MSWSFMISLFMPLWQYKSQLYFFPKKINLFRLLQGFSVSGEEGGAVVFMFEKENFCSEGRIGSYVLASVLFGVLLGSIVCWVTAKFIPTEALFSWGWRVPFILAFP